MRLVEEPLVNLVRRPGCPLLVQDADGPTTYVEGRDFAELRDPQLGVTPWKGEFDVYHQPPVLRLLPGSRVRDRQRLHVSYYHAVKIYDGQVPCSLSEPKVFEVVEDQVLNDAEILRGIRLGADDSRCQKCRTGGRQIASAVPRKAG